MHEETLWDKACVLLKLPIERGVLSTQTPSKSIPPLLPNRIHQAPLPCRPSAEPPNRKVAQVVTSKTSSL